MPLSPILFILSLEPFIRMVNRDKSITGFEVAGKEYKIAAYADDLLLFLNGPSHHCSQPDEAVYTLWLYFKP